MGVIVQHFEDQRLDLARVRLLVYVFNEVALALDTSVGDLTDLLRIEGFPRLIVQVCVERHDIDRVYEVDEGVADIASVVQVEGQIEEVEASCVISVDALQQHLLSVLVGDVSDHDCRAKVFSAQDSVQIDRKLRVRLLVAIADG